VTVSERTGAPFLIRFRIYAALMIAVHRSSKALNRNFRMECICVPKFVRHHIRFLDFSFPILRFAADLTDHGGDEFALTSKIVAVERRLGASFPGLNE
jgi:hypothetical protein